MEFNINNPILYILVAVIIAVVMAQSIYFLVRAIKRARQLGISDQKLKKTITSAAIFTIAPAVAILVGVISLSKSLGVALPWLRLSVIGSITYEAVAAGNALTALNLDLNTPISNPSAYVTVLWVMTIGILLSVILAPVLTPKIQKGMNKIEKKDKKWREILTNAMFLGMISAFLGYVFCDVGTVFTGSLKGLIPVCVMVVSAVAMAICGILSSKLKQRWITDYALPISLISGMASAIPLTNILG